MKCSLQIAAILAIILFIENCHGDYRSEAVGQQSSVIVIMDSTQWKGQVANAIRNVYEQGVKGVPRWEPIMNLHFRDFSTNKELNKLLRYKNIIIAAPIEDTSNTAKFIRSLLANEVIQQVKKGNYFAFPLKNHWRRNQWTIILTSNSSPTLARKIIASKNRLAHQIVKVQLDRWKKRIYSQGEQTDIEDSLWANHGWEIRVEHGWYKHIDTTYTANGKDNHFVTMRWNMPENLRWFWAWWTNNPPPKDTLNPDWINNKRDSLNRQFIRGTRDSSYVSTDYEHYKVFTDTLSVDSLPAYETRGIWRMTHGTMAGPFVNMTIRDTVNGRLFLLEFGQFAPTHEKRSFVRKFRAMLRTFISDSTWSAKRHKQAVRSE
jgi:hypothetical protein